uniref:Gypsy retrotransposon integrase-like protein 1 n=1 Tax=Paramormyrops kingsleyae TaxID=1676925 RepID=A0A3B3TCZ3_9TELE
MDGFEVDWLSIHARDPDLAKIRQWKVREVAQPVDPQSLTPDGRRLMGEWVRLCLYGGVLRWQSQDPATGQLMSPAVVPVLERHKVWFSYHQALGHARGQRMVQALRGRVFWKGMVGDLRHWEAECQQCVLGWARLEEKVPLHPVVSRYPFEILAMDYLSLGQVNDCYPYILVITDLFSRYAVAIPMKDQSAQTTVKALWRNVIQVVRELCELYGCTKSRTTPYHPQGNRACEWFNKTLLGLLNTLDQEGQVRWAEQLPYLLQAYNNIPHSSTALLKTWILFIQHISLCYMIRCFCKQLQNNVA